MPFKLMHLCLHSSGRAAFGLPACLPAFLPACLLRLLMLLLMLLTVLLGN